MAALLCWAARVAAAGKISWIRTPLDGPLLVGAVYVTARYATSPVEWISRQEMLLVLMYVSVYFLVTQHFFRRRRQNALLWLLMVVAVGITAGFTPQNAAGLLPEFRRLSDEGNYYVTNAGRYFLIYNTDKVKPEEAPKAWTDLLDPTWKGRVATGHPAFSGCTGVWALAMRKLYGWEYFEKLAKNAPRIGRSFNDPVTLITSGECSVGPGPANSTYPAIERGNPLGIVYPEDGCSLCVSPAAIPATAPHPNAARLFLNWLLSDTYSQLSIDRGSEAFRPGATPKPGRTPAEKLKLLHLTVAEIRKGVPEVIEQWRDTFGS